MPCPGSIKKLALVRNCHRINEIVWPFVGNQPRNNWASHLCVDMLDSVDLTTGCNLMNIVQFPGLSSRPPDLTTLLEDVPHTPASGPI